MLDVFAEPEAAITGELRPEVCAECAGCVRAFEWACASLGASLPPSLLPSCHSLSPTPTLAHAHPKARTHPLQDAL